MRIALVHSQAALDQDALTLAFSLRSLGHAVTLLAPQQNEDSITSTRAAVWQAHGFPWVPVFSARMLPTHEHFPRDPAFALAKSLADIATSFDCAWFFEDHWAMPLLRARRFREERKPFVVRNTVVDGNLIPSSLDEINRSFASQYARRWADATCNGTTPPYAELVLRELAALRNGVESQTRERSTPASPDVAVTVCIPFFEDADFLPATLQSLERQTSNNFTVVVVDDGSYSSEARLAFNTCADLYSPRGWKFIQQTNRSSSAARNRAAKEALTEFLLFLDADDIAMPFMIERFLRAARLTGDDCLVAPNYGFTDDPDGPCSVLYDPPGNSLIGSMCDDMHGGSCIFIRRTAFWSIGGFTELQGLGFEDYELHVRANLQGLRWDVLPEYMYRYRMPGEHNVSRSTPKYPNQRRVLYWYERQLRSEVGGTSLLESLPLALSSAYSRHVGATEKLKQMETIVSSRRPKRSPSGSELKILLLTCNFPFGIVSGWHTRVQQMVRYFGSRYDLTLMTMMSREQFKPNRKQTLRYLRSVLGVEGSNVSAASHEDLPYRVQQAYINTFQAALRNLQTDSFHVAIMDQVFMAEFRHDIDAIKVLTEHNIESLLLQQAASRSWSHELPDAYHDMAMESLRLRQYEDRVWPEFALRSVVSEVDRAHMQQRLGKNAKQSKTVVAPNGADLESWLPDIRFHSQTILFVGHLAYLPNVDAINFLLLDIWPRIKSRRPTTRLIIAGRDPSDEVKRAVKQATKETGFSIELHANPKSMDRLARQASISIAPLRLGSGTRCKILESMAWGLPVVSTMLGAEGIEAEDGEHLLIRNGPEEFADAVIQLLADAELWQKLRATGRQLVREKYSWERVFEPLEDGLLELIS